MKYAKKASVVEAVTFDEFVEYGRQQGVPLTNGMPWSFVYQNHPVTHENDFKYIIGGMLQFNEGQMLLAHEGGALTVCSMEDFDTYYVKIEEGLLE